MSEVLDFIQRVIDRTGFTREVFVDRKLPLNLSRLRIIPFFGDSRSEFVLATLILPRLFPEDYTIVCSWPGHGGLYSGISEYWSITDEDALSDLARNLDGFNNFKAGQYERLLLRYFDNVTTIDQLVPQYYLHGFGEMFFENFDKIEYHLPSLPSVSLGWDDTAALNRKERIFLMPTKYITRWSNKGSSSQMFVEEKFWSNLVNKLLARDYMPILMQNYMTYDLSPEFASQCAYITERNILARLGVMRACDCVLDVFNGLSRYALAARCPYFICDERQRYFSTRDYILDDLCGSELPKGFLFSFAPMATTDAAERVNSAIVNRLYDFLLKVNRNSLPSTVECTQSLSYDNIRKREINRIGVRFISLPQEDK